MPDAAEWGPDPEPDIQERSWDRDTRTAETGPGWKGPDLDRPPDHAPQLHRAMSEAAADLEAVDDRLSMLFDRTEEPRPATAPRRAAHQPNTVHPEFAAEPGTTGAGDADDILDFFADGEMNDPDDVVGNAEPAVTDRMAIIGEYEDDIGGDFSALDAELAAEEPDGPAQPKRRMFRRRAKGSTAAQH